MNWVVWIFHAKAMRAFLCFSLLILNNTSVWAKRPEYSEWKEAVSKHFKDATILITAHYKSQEEPAYPSSLRALILECQERDTVSNSCQLMRAHDFEQKLISGRATTPVKLIYTRAATFSPAQFQELISRFSKHGLVRQKMQQFLVTRPAGNLTGAMIRHLNSWDNLLEIMLLAPFTIIADIATFPGQFFVPLFERALIKDQINDIKRKLENFLFHAKDSKPEHVRNFWFFQDIALLAF